MHPALTDQTGPGRDGAAIRQRLAFDSPEVAAPDFHGPARAQVREQGLSASGKNAAYPPPPVMRWRKAALGA
jgi:hypothetical protein